MRQLIDREEVLEIVREWCCIVERHVGKNACVDLYEDLQVLPTHKAGEENEWVKVEERKPLIDHMVLVMLKGNPYIYIGSYLIDDDNCTYWATDDDEPVDVTHWRNLPQPPEA